MASQASQAGNQALAGVHLPSQEVSNLAASQAGIQTQAGAHLPSGKEAT